MRRLLQMSAAVVCALVAGGCDLAMGIGPLVPESGKPLRGSPRADTTLNIQADAPLVVTLGDTLPLTLGDTVEIQAVVVVNGIQTGQHAGWEIADPGVATLGRRRIQDGGTINDGLSSLPPTDGSRYTVLETRSVGTTVLTALWGSLRDSVLVVVGQP